MKERWRSAAARDLVKAIRRAGGEVERVGRGRLRITGPGGVVTIAEPGGENRRDQRRSSADRLIIDRCGLLL
jgi:hypothetical protein